MKHSPSGAMLPTCRLHPVSAPAVMPQVLQSPDADAAEGGLRFYRLLPLVCCPRGAPRVLGALDRLMAPEFQDLS